MITQFAVKENEIGLCTCMYPLFNCCYRVIFDRINQTSFQCSMNTIKALFCFLCGMMCRLVYTEGAHVGLNIKCPLIFFLPKLKWYDSISESIFSKRCKM
jgi:hypothetical protein